MRVCELEQPVRVGARVLVLFVLVAMLGTISTAQQGGSSAGPGFPAEAKQAYDQIKGNLVKAAEKMPEENYSFKPTPETRNFGQLVAHAADVQLRFCAMVTGADKKPNASSKTSKADLVAALKESVEECDQAHSSVNDANASQIVPGGRTPRSRLGTLAFNTAHSNETYGTMVVYLRLKGIVPPSSEK